MEREQKLIFGYMKDQTPLMHIRVKFATYLWGNISRAQNLIRFVRYHING